MRNNIYFKNFILKTIDTVVALLVPIIVFPYVARVIGAEKLGIIDFAQSYGYYFIHIANFGLNSYALRELSKVRDNHDKAEKIGSELFSINVIFSLISGLVFIISSLFIPKFNGHFIIFAIYSLIIFTDFLQIDWVLQSFDDYLFSTIRSFILRLISTILIFALIKDSNDFYLYMIITTISEMGSRIININYVRIKYISLKFSLLKTNIKTHFIPLFNLFSFRLINGLWSKLDKLMIGFIMTYKDVSLYSTGIKFILIIAGIIEIVGTVLFPKINNLANNSVHKYKEVLELNYNLILLLGIPMCIGFFIVAPYVIYLFGGEEYLESIIVARLMSIVIILCPIGDLFGSKTLLVKNKDKQLLITSVVVSLTNIVLNSVLIRPYGINGAAVASVVSYLVAIIMRIYFSNKFIKIPILNKNVIKYCLFCIPFILIYMPIKKIINDNIYIVFIYIFVCTIIYLLELVLTNDFSIKLVKGSVFCNK